MHGGYAVGDVVDVAVPLERDREDAAGLLHHLVRRAGQLEQVAHRELVGLVGVRSVGRSGGLARLLRRRVDQAHATLALVRVRVRVRVRV